MVTVRFICGHAARVDPATTTAPMCVCGERKVQRVTAPPPRFSGMVAGPLAVSTGEGPRKEFTS